MAVTATTTDLPSPAVARKPRAAGRLARGAFCVMTRQVTVVSAGVDVALLLLLPAFGSPLLAWIDLASFGLCAIAQARRQGRPSTVATASRIRSARSASGGRIRNYSPPQSATTSNILRLTRHNAPLVEHRPQAP